MLILFREFVSVFRTLQGFVRCHGKESIETLVEFRNAIEHEFRRLRRSPLTMSNPVANCSERKPLGLVVRWCSVSGQ